MHAEQTCPSWRIPDGLWARMESFLPKYRKSPLGGRPRLDLRKVADGIFYVLRTGCQWKAAPAGVRLRQFLAPLLPGVGTDAACSTSSGSICLRRYDDLRGIQWKWQSLDGSTTKAPLGGEKNREKPDGSGQIGRQAVGADRWPRRAPGRGDCRRQCA